MLIYFFREKSLIIHAYSLEDRYVSLKPFNFVLSLSSPFPISNVYPDLRFNELIENFLYFATLKIVLSTISRVFDSIVNVFITSLVQSATIIINMYL